MTCAGDSKACRVCGRSFAWRKRWADCWDGVRYCSAACRKRGLKPVDERLEKAIEVLLHQRAGTSICPSEAARVVDPRNWKPLMEPARMAARRLARRGRVRILKHGREPIWCGFMACSPPTHAIAASSCPRRRPRLHPRTPRPRGRKPGPP